MYHGVRSIWATLFAVLLGLASLGQAASVEDFGFRVFEGFNLNYEEADMPYPSLFKKYLGSPQEVRKWQTPDPSEPGYVKSYERWDYEGFHLTIFRSIRTKSVNKQPEDDFVLESVIVEDPSITLSGGLHIGSALNTFVSELGLIRPRTDPSARKVSFLAQHQYSFKGFAVEQNVTIEFKLKENDDVAAIKWTYWAD